MRARIWLGSPYACTAEQEEQRRFNITALFSSVENIKQEYETVHKVGDIKIVKASAKWSPRDRRN